MRVLPESLVRECKRRLLEAKVEILNRVSASRTAYESLDRSGGDEGDQTMNLIAENDFLSTQIRLKQQLLEIEFALARIENGCYGICEETEEPIEVERLKTLPWTRLSIEGAELRETVSRKFAR